jgi:hypothetical protein
MFFLALQELYKDYGPTRVAKKLNEILKNEKKIANYNVKNWINGSIPRAIIQDAVIYLYIQEKGEKKLQNLISNYIHGIMAKF